MKRPSYQYYPADDVNDPELRRSSFAAQGVWVRIKAVLHTSEEYGVRRWPLREIAHGAGVPLRYARELAAKNVLKGGDAGCGPFIFVPRHAGQDGPPITLIEAGTTPCWYCARMVRDEYIRSVRGSGTRYSPMGRPNAQPNGPPNPAPRAAPKDAIGEGRDDGASSSSSFSLESSTLASGGRAGSRRALLFSEGVSLLAAADVPKDTARRFLGSLLRDHGDADVLRAITAAKASLPIADPRAWLKAHLGRRGRAPDADLGEFNYTSGIPSEVSQ